ncbi:hypothetical protein HY491_03845, partial [Candidatus Woesearchaeota archaeon]|nr:hypothetical protein [Candidatus Woesearchaeota archaeon]
GFDLNAVYQQEERKRQQQEQEAARQAAGSKKPGQRKGRQPADSPDAPPLDAPYAGFCITEQNDRYTLHNVPYGNHLWAFSWSKKLLDGGKSHTQDNWVTLTKDAAFRLASGPVYAASMMALSGSRNAPDAQQQELGERVRQMFAGDFATDKLYQLTSTRVRYAAAGQDMVVHGHGYPDPATVNAVIVGQDREPEAGDAAALDALLGTRDVQRFAQAVEWITGKRPYLYRFNSPPTKDVERVLRLGCYANGFYVYAYGVVNDEWPARGVVAQREKIRKGNKVAMFSG